MSRDLGETRPLPSMTDMDPDALFRCPYDPSHIICAKRYTYHVAKCSLTNKKVAQNMRTCPFNARHRILKSNMAEHLAQCPDRRTVGQTEVTQGAVRAERGDGHSSVPQSSGEVQPCQEDWDAEMEQDGEQQPYIWGISAMPRSKTTRPPPDMPVFAVPDYLLSSSRGHGARRGNNSAAGPSGRQLASTTDPTGSKHKTGNAWASASCTSRGGAAWQ
ncbi:gametocyte-specific factor 1-like isoform X2 [Lampetra fluviatilis]